MHPPRNRALLIGPALSAMLFAATRLAGFEADASWTAAVTALCATWWITEAIPLPATSLIPFVAFPLTGVLDHRTVAHAYGHFLVLLLLGGFMLSKAVERSGAHRRMAIGMLRVVGRFGRRGLVLGFMLATAACSMWISNTASVLMMLPVAFAILETEDSDDLRVPLLLGIAYAGSIGGIGTPIGTPPNATCLAVYSEFAADGEGLSFPEWMAYGIPIVLIMIPIAWLVLTRNLGRGGSFKIDHPGAWQSAERRVLVVFTLTALAWIFRTAPFGGWTNWLGLTGVGDETVALAAVVSLFVIPSGAPDRSRMLDWETASDIPWGLLILFGGGIAIADAFQASGLSTSIGQQLESLATQPPILVVASICLVVTFLTEVTSNTATTALLMPILASAGTAAGVDLRLLMIPAAASASCAFMLPVATAPNAIVFGTGEITVRRMAAEGIRLNLLGILVVTTVCTTIHAVSS